jgi:hypothetical protein
MAEIIQNNNNSIPTNGSFITAKPLFLLLKRKTISGHLTKIVKNLHNNRDIWTWQNSAFMIRMAFWIPIYLFGGYLTMSTSIELIKQYRENPIYLSMTAVINRPSVALPNYTACVYFNVTKVFDAVDYANNRNESVSSFSEILENFFSAYSENIKTVNSNSTQWPNTTNGVIVRYLIMMYEMEALRNSNELPFNYQQFQENDDYWSAVRNVFAPKIEEYNITIDKLKAVLSETFSGSNNDGDSINYYNCLLYLRTTQMDTCAPSKLISFIDQDSICFRLVDSQLSKIGNNAFRNIFKIYANIADWDGERATELRGLYSLDFSGRSTPPSQSQ